MLMNTTERKAIDGQAASLMVMLCAIWGLQQVVLKATAPDMAPVLQIAIRSGIASIVVYLLVLVRRETGAMKDGMWKPGLAVGALFALEFLFVGEGLRFTSASHMVIFLYTAPIFAALGLHLKMPEERLTVIQWCGIGVAFAGVVISFVGRSDGGGPGSDTMWIGDLLGIAGGAAWGATTLTVRFSRLANAPATVTLLYQLVGAFGLLLIAAILLEQMAVVMSARLIAGLSFQVILVSLVSFLIWFSLLRTYLASRLGVLSFMTPIFGVIFGVLILSETLDLSFILGASMILAGIMLVSGHELLKGSVARKQRSLS